MSSISIEPRKVVALPKWFSKIITQYSGYCSGLVLIRNNYGTTYGVIAIAFDWLNTDRVMCACDWLKFRNQECEGYDLLQFKGGDIQGNTYTYTVTYSSHCHNNKICAFIVKS